MNKNILHTIVIALLCLSFASDKPAYRIYNANGKQRDYKDIVKDALDADIILFGEQHYNPIAHWLQFELAQDIFKARSADLIIGAEMFESDNQIILNEYLTDRIKTRNFEDEARLWPNYKTDYKPILEFAKTNNIPFIATNIPRRYASMVNRGGFEILDSIDVAAKAWIVPLPVAYDSTLTIYVEMMSMDEGGSSHVTPNLPKAQAIKDATMAWFILKNFKKGNIFLHYNGSGHSDYFEGIAWYIKQSRPDLKVLTLSTVEQEKIEKLDSASTGLAHYILCVPETMTATRPSSGR